MELMFNELSTIPASADKHIAAKKMEVFSQAVAASRKKGHRKVRSHFDSSQIDLSSLFFARLDNG